MIHIQFQAQLKKHRILILAAASTSTYLLVIGQWIDRVFINERTYHNTVELGWLVHSETTKYAGPQRHVLPLPTNESRTHIHIMKGHSYIRNGTSLNQ